MAGKAPTKMGIWEYGRRRLGYGDYDAEVEPVYQKWAGMEAHKLWLAMKKRNIGADEFFMAVDYCHRHRIHIPNPVWVFKHIPDARHEVAERAKTEDVVSQELAEAMAYERALAAPDSAQWIERFARSRGLGRKEALIEWKQQRAPWA